MASTALVASPFDFSRVPLVAPLRPIAAVTQGQLVTQLYRVLGGAPAPLVKRGYQLAGFDKYVMKPWTIATNLHDRELLAQIEAVDVFMDNMHAYPGRTFGQLYHRFFRTNDLAGGRLELSGRTLDLAGGARARALDRRRRRRDRARRGVPSRRRAAHRRAVGAAGDRAGRAPRRPDRARGPRHDLGRARPLPGRGYPGRMRRALIPSPSSSRSRCARSARRDRAGPPARGADPGRRDGLRRRRRQPHGAEATARLGQTLGPVLAQDIAVSAAGRTFPLKMSALKFKFRADKTALRALYAGRAAPQAPDGTLPPASATPSVAYRRKPVWRFARRTAAKVDKQARDARIRIKTYRITKVAGRKGRKLGVRALVAAIQATVPNPAAVRTIAGKVTVTTPRIRTRELAKAYPSVITIDQSSFRLRLFKRLKFVKGYGVAVGQPAYPTPNGRFALQSKQVDPVWTAPNSPWAGEMGGQSVSGGAAEQPAQGALDGRQRLGRHPWDGRAVVDRHARLARLHPDDRARRGRPVRPRQRRHAGPHRAVARGGPATRSASGSHRAA